MAAYHGNYEADSRLHGDPEVSTILHVVCLVGLPCGAQGGTDEGYNTF